MSTKYSTMSIETLANCSLIIFRDYYVSLGEALVQLHELRGYEYQFPSGGPIRYKHRSVLHQCDKKGSFMPYLNSLCLIEIRDILQLCIDHTIPNKKGMNKALIVALGNDLEALSKEFSSYNEKELEKMEFPPYPKEAINCARSIIREIDEIVALHKNRMAAAKEKEKLTKSKIQSAAKPQQQIVNHTKPNSDSIIFLTYMRPLLYHSLF